ncbi:hypothetical protein M422DRAFT_258899 [Sphaerobolus stellatus SS14]|uniref:Uncharacterized protein n=1 Tax=Sphaerobolus stellatus (strain SS14) TaxID=990650 RepID=A0A0C9UUI8_SPHS4|nr:hypothetical protein M422DRAFT_258899 [Sphaerobolus stellatus SS14]
MSHRETITLVLYGTCKAPTDSSHLSLPQSDTGGPQGLPVSFPRVFSTPSARYAAPPPPTSPTAAISVPRHHLTPLHADPAPERHWEGFRASQHCSSVSAPPPPFTALRRRSLQVPPPPSQCPTATSPLSTPIPPQSNARRPQSLSALFFCVLSTSCVHRAVPPPPMSPITTISVPRRPLTPLRANIAPE